MLRRWLLYLAAVAACVIFYSAHRQWISWFFLVTALCLPFVSLLLSLPAMLTVRSRLHVPEQLRLPDTLSLQMQLRSILPVMALQGQLQLDNVLTGEQTAFPAAQAPAELHCGLHVLRTKKLWTCDYLGLFPLGIRRKDSYRILVLPQPVPMKTAPGTAPAPVKLWRPKVGGGFAENHDLRLYRPGDSLRQIHWKISAKTGKLIYREPIEPVKHKTVIALSLSGSADSLDEKLGRLLWLSRYLLEKQQVHELRCSTGKGLMLWDIQDDSNLQTALRDLLSTPAAATDTLPDTSDAARCYVIGGEADD